MLPPEVMDGFGGLPSSARYPKKAKHGSLVAVSEAQGLGLVYGVVGVMAWPNAGPEFG